MPEYFLNKDRRMNLDRELIIINIVLILIEKTSPFHRPEVLLEIVLMNKFTIRIYQKIMNC